MRKPIQYVIISGGLDSAVALSQAILHGSVEAITFRYGQRHDIELEHAKQLCEHYGVPLKTVNLEGLLHSESLLKKSTTNIPTGEYEAESMASTEVQGRNLLFTSVAIAHAKQGDSITLGVHGGDHDLYPDCRPEFWDHLHALGQAYGVNILTPFLHLSKQEIVRLGHTLKTPFELTWSCYQGGDTPCLKCSTCLEREAAFRGSNLTDPYMEARTL